MGRRPHHGGYHLGGSFGLEAILGGPYSSSGVSAALYLENQSKETAKKQQDKPRPGEESRYREDARSLPFSPDFPVR